MLSICIPVHNYDIRRLILDLEKQIQDSDIETEINILDDGSKNEYRKLNYEVTSNKAVNYKEQNNQGRSITRNKLGDMSSGSHIIFIDCDCLVPENYLDNYSSSCEHDVVIGGLQYGDKPQRRALLLRWNYGIKREMKIDYSTNKLSFLSSNFMIRKSIFKLIRFDSNFNTYGHEDTMLGIQLRKNNIKITQIQNPVVHLGLEPSNTFLNKTEEALRNFLTLFNNINHEELENNKLSLLLRLKTPTFLNWIISRIFIINRPFLRWMMKDILPSIKLFDYYKFLFIFHLKYTLNKN